MTNQDLIIIKSSLSRACAYARAPCTFALFAFTTFTDFRVIHSILVVYQRFVNIFLMFHAECYEKWAKRLRRRGKIGGKSRRVSNKGSWGRLLYFWCVWEGMIRKLGAFLENVGRFPKNVGLFLKNLPRFLFYLLVFFPRIAMKQSPCVKVVKAKSAKSL